MTVEDPADPPAEVIHGVATQINRCCGHSRLKSFRFARGWTVREAIRELGESCGQMPERGVTERLWRKWEAGGGCDRDYQDRLSRLFQANPVLLGFAADYTPARQPPEQAANDKTLTDRALAAELRDSMAFARRIANSIVSETALDQLDKQVAHFGRYYVSQPLAHLVGDIRSLRHHIFTLIDGNRHPEQSRHLYLLASRVCGLETHIALDLGNYLVADAQADTAWLFADLAGSHQARAWVRSVQSLIAYWDGRLPDAIDLARDGMRYPTTDSSSVRLPSLEARACAALSDTRGALAALATADAARERALHPEDEIGGVFTFPAAKQAAYGGTSRLALHQADQLHTAIDDSQRAIILYESGPVEDRSTGDLLAARLDLATAYLVARDLDAVHEQVEVVLAVPPERRTASIIKRAHTLIAELDVTHYRRSPFASSMVDHLSAFVATSPALPGGQDKGPE